MEHLLPRMTCWTWMPELTAGWASRSTGSHRHAKRIKQRAPAAAPEPSAPLEDSSEASEVAALQTALQELLDGMDAWKADVLDAPAEDASGDAEADTPLRSQAGDGVRPWAAAGSSVCSVRLRAWPTSRLLHWCIRISKPLPGLGDY